ncbi:MAG: beta-lactamase family protein, partial [Clostridia bacterium]|nr:beta-lactamase family protein [Clostridia bacterium]
YSCPGFIVLGKILEKIYGQSLDKAFENFVAKPLGLTETKFIPQRRENVINANLSEELRGIVNDHNCRFLGQVAGNAGVFSNIVDMTKYVQCLLNKGEPLFSEKTFSLATKNYTSDKSESRGLGFLYVDNRYEQTGGLFADGAIGHCGHTGQSVFLDYRTGLYVVILSDATVATIKKYGAERYDEVMKMRKELHCAIKNDLKF